MPWAEDPCSDPQPDPQPDRGPANPTVPSAPHMAGVQTGQRPRTLGSPAVLPRTDRHHLHPL